VVTAFVLPNLFDIGLLFVRVDVDGTHVVCAPILALEPLRASGVKTGEPQDRWHHKGTKTGSQCWPPKDLTILLCGKCEGLPVWRDGVLDLGLMSDSESPGLVQGLRWLTRGTSALQTSFTVFDQWHAGIINQDPAHTSGNSNSTSLPCHHRVAHRLRPSPSPSSGT
jgi:hypothetical protein